jgi:hypothetical protein
MIVYVNVFPEITIQYTDLLTQPLLPKIFIYYTTPLACRPGEQPVPQ